MRHPFPSIRRGRRRWPGLRIAVVAVLIAITPGTLSAREAPPSDSHGAGASVATTGPRYADTPPSPLTLPWCLDRARAHNSAIAEAEAAADAARARIVVAGALEDPRLRYEASNIPIGDRDFDSTPLSGHHFGWSQRLPFPGVRANRRAAAEAGASAAASSHDDRQRRIVSAVEAAWAELGFAQRALDIDERNIALLRHLVRVAEAKYRVGNGLQQDVLRAQVELTALLAQKLGREAQIERASSRLAALLDIDADLPFPRTDALDDASPIPALAGLLDRAAEKNPQLVALRSEIEAARHRVHVTRLESYPDFDLGLGYRLRERVSGDPVGGDDFVGASVTVRLPIDRAKWEGRLGESRALLRRSEAAYRSEHAELHAQLRSAHADLVRADSELTLLTTGLVPQAQQSLESSRSGYEVGRVDFPSLLDSQVRLLEAELRLIRTRADRRRAFAALEAASGETLR